MNFEDFKIQQESKLKHAPHMFWAKKFDTEIHIPVKGFGGGTMCGSVAARLGNNYAPIYQHKPLCAECARLVYNEEQLTQNQ